MKEGDNMVTTSSKFHIEDSENAMSIPVAVPYDSGYLRSRELMKQELRNIRLDPIKSKLYYE